MLCGDEARAQEDSAEPDIRITLWNSIPGRGDMMSYVFSSVQIYWGSNMELNSIWRSLSVIIVRALIYLNWLWDWPMSWHLNTRYFNKLSYFVWSPLISRSAIINNIRAQTQHKPKPSPLDRAVTSRREMIYYQVRPNYIWFQYTVIQKTGTRMWMNDFKMVVSIPFIFILSTFKF